MGSMLSKIYPGSISDSNITEKTLMWLAGFRNQNIKGLSSNIFLVSKMFFEKANVRNIIQFSEAEVATNFDITPTSFHIQRFTGHVYDWSILNHWSIQKIDLLTLTSGSLCNIVKYLTHAAPTCKVVKLMVKVSFSVLICKTFKAFMEAMIYTLFGVTTRLKFLQEFLFLKIYQGLRENGKRCKNLLQLVKNF